MILIYFLMFIIIGNMILAIVEKNMHSAMGWLLALLYFISINIEKIIYSLKGLI